MSDSYVYITRLQSEQGQNILLFGLTTEPLKIFNDMADEFGSAMDIVAMYPGNQDSLDDILDRTKRYQTEPEERSMTDTEYDDFIQSLQMTCDRKHARRKQSNPTSAVILFWKHIFDTKDMQEKTPIVKDEIFDWYAEFAPSNPLAKSQFWKETYALLPFTEERKQVKNSRKYYVSFPSLADIHRIMGMSK